MDTFGVGARGTFTYITSEGTEHRVRGIFDKAYVAQDPGTNAAVQSLGPALGVKLSDLPRAPKRNDRVLVEDQIYKIEHMEKDVHGGAILFLHEVDE